MIVESGGEWCVVGALWAGRLGMRGGFVANREEKTSKCCQHGRIWGNERGVRGAV